MTKRRIIITTILLVLLVLFCFNFRTLKDLFLSIIYQPTPEISELESALSLTSYGRTIFRASSPELDDQESFNEHCVTLERSTSVLGCYVDEHIYVYNITSSEVSGIVESTTAHELLHAVWARLSSSEKTVLTSTLEEVYDNASESFRESIDPYDASERLEEIYVRSATQISSLPENLESHFAKIFTDQDSVVAYYDSYIAPFNTIKSSLNTLSTEINNLRETIDKNLAEYTTRSDAYSASVTSFNNCATTSGCFNATSFAEQRSALLTEKAALNSLYDLVSEEIELYNQKVSAYNSNVLHGQTLQNLINSNVSPDNI